MEMFNLLKTSKRIVLDKRIIHVSGKRQITIPLKYYQSLGLSDQVECYLEDGALIIRPLINTGNEFSIEILKDLVAQGFSGDELIKKFAENSQQIKKAIRSLLEEADDIASGQHHSASMVEVFGDSVDV
jgi:bifunctional DNA-binding transcriptional regulator/antitoxin component of YhaV-PrlF toxin-antitoxin module